ncbi:MAG: AbrB/MazE/SpoVT family DNA-binding domain-containing protein [Smithella sp.]
MLNVITMCTPLIHGGKIMRAHIVKIGNSQGIRIPKPLLDQTGIVDDVELEVETNQIIIRPISNPRAGWDNAFKTMAKNGHDKLIDGDEIISNYWDEEEWQW